MKMINFIFEILIYAFLTLITWHPELTADSITFSCCKTFPLKLNIKNSANETLSVICVLIWNKWFGCKNRHIA